MTDNNYILNLPKTSFPMKANLQRREINFYEKNDLIYEELNKKNKNKKKFILHDGPPYANGDLHMGHALNKILKDFIIRYKNMSGYNAPLILGWDTHGLPIEINVIKKFGTHSQGNILDYRQKCKNFAIINVNKQMDQFKKLNILADWDKSYLTCNFDFEARQLKLFFHMLTNNYIYKGFKPVYWCIKDKTALAEAEIEYQNKICKSIYVKFKILDHQNKFSMFMENIIYFVIWTTTPWTLLSNVALAVNKDFSYCLIRNLSNDEIYIIAKDLLDKFAQISNNKYKIIKDNINGFDLEYMIAINPINNQKSLIILSNHVNLNSGTGIVHIAPGHGLDDYIACQSYNIPINICVNEFGNIISSPNNIKYSNMKYIEANEAIIKDLYDNKMIIAFEEINHSYPHCWRCKTPIIFRATKQWFCSVNKLKKNAINICDNIKWIPSWGKERMIKMLQDRNDWCISRQRLWGVPIPIFYCKKCDQIINNNEINKNIIKLFEHYGSDCWYSKDFLNMLNCEIKCKCGAEKENIIQEFDIMDVWFDSGTSHFLLLENNQLKWPADICLEGNDQYRGWFQSSLLTAIAFNQQSPYKAIITHGWITDDKGDKMSKSSGNGINPINIINKFGTDILRLCICSMDFKTDISINENLLKQIQQSYTKIRNTSRFILGNINNIVNTVINFEDNNLIDKIILSKLNNLIKKVTDYYEKYEFHMIFYSIYKFCTIDLSSFYFDIIKDTLYCDNENNNKRVNVQAILYNILCNITKLLAPILPFTTQEIWDEIKNITNISYVMLSDFPKYNKKYELSDFENQQFIFLSKLKNSINKELELTRKTNNHIGKSLEVYVLIKINKFNYNLINELNLNEILIVSQNEIIVDDTYDNDKLEISIKKTELAKCNRCWKHSNNITKDLCLRCYKIVHENI